MKTIAPDYGLSDAEVQAVFLAVEGKSTKLISHDLEISEDAVRKRLSEVYRKCKVEGRGPVKLARLQQMLMARYQGSQGYRPPAPPERAPAQMPQGSIEGTKLLDWGEAPEISSFYGRQSELALLNQWTQQDRCRLILLYGLKGMGKTTLAVKLAEQANLQTQFDGIIWRSLQHGPSLDRLLDELFACLKIPAPTQRQETRARISQLLEVLQNHRYLIILDNGESLLKHDDFAGQYLDIHQDYGELFQRLSEARHQSCLILTSTEKLRDISLLEGEQSPVRAFQLKGLQMEAAIELLAARGLKQSEQKSWRKLISLYNGNPLALKIVAATIQILFDGSVSEFFSQNTTLILHDVRDLIEEQFGRISKLEKEIMFWLALSSDSLDLADIKQSLALPFDASELMQALASLSQRSLVEKDRNNPRKFKLQDVVSQYITELLFEIVLQETCELIRNYAEITQQPVQNKVQTLRQLCLIRLKLFDNQQQNIPPSLIQMKNKLLEAFVDKTMVVEALSQILTWLEEETLVETKYAQGNLKGLMALLNACP